MLLDKWGTRAIKNENLPLISNSLYTKTLSSVLRTRSKNEAWIPWCSTLSSVSLGYIFMIVVRNSLPLFTAQRSSVNLETS